MDAVDAVVVGAGVVGLAIARQLALAGREVLILEAESTFGSQTSSRNSEIIHAGIYYPTGSLKARLCLEGKELLYRYCAERDIGHRRIGKLLIATEESELPALAGYAKRGAANGVPLQPLTAAEVRALEPAVRALAGLYSELTGIVDSHGRSGTRCAGSADMTWATISTGINATVADHCGEVSTLVVSGVPYQVHAVIVSEPTPIGDSDARESVPTAQVPSPEVPYAPRAGDPFIDALGLRWLIDRADLSEGMWSLTLRKDPAA